jgi:protein-tyrosine phosphatase
MSENNSRHIPLSGTYNIRDLGGYKTHTGARVPWQTFFRGDNPNLLSVEGMNYLYGQGLRLVIDLRTKNEIKEASNPFENFPGVEYINLPIFDDLAPVIMLQKQVSDENPLLHFYLEAIHGQGNAIKEVLKRISTIQDGAVMFNCTAGKDRTGIIAALLLGLVGVSEEEIVKDYALTASLIPGLADRLLAESKARGINTERHSRMLESPGEVMKALLSEIENKFGSIENYLKENGMEQEEIQRLKKLLSNKIR